MGKGTSGRPEGCPHGYASEELGDGANDLEDFLDPSNRIFLFIEVCGIDGDITEHVRAATLSQDLDSADSIEHNGIGLAILDIVNGTFAHCNDIAMIDLWLHRVARDIAPYLCFFEARHNHVAIWYRNLAVEHLIEATEEIHVKIWLSLPLFERYFGQI